MKRRLIACAFIAVLALSGPTTAPVLAGTFIWTGLGTDTDITTAGNWQGGNPPLFDGTDNLILGKAINNSLYLSSDTLVNSLNLTSGDDYHFTSATVVLRISNNAGYGIYGAVSGNNSRMVFDSSIDIAANGGGTLRMDAGDNTLAFAGKIIDDPLGGITTVILSNANGGTMGAFVFNDTCTGSSYTGDTFITGLPGQPVTVAFWNDQPFGNGGTLYIQNAAQLIAHGTREVDNDIQISTTDTISFKSWDATVCYDGDLTLAANTTLAAQRSTQGVPSSDTSGVYPLPGPMTRYAIDFEGDIDQTGGPRTLTVNGQGVIVFEGTNSYTGGTVVGSGGANGSLVFGYASSVPVTGTVTANTNGYVGFADNTPGNFGTFLNGGAFNLAGSTGAVGLDTLPRAGSTTIFDDPINLSLANVNLRLGSATSAILSSTAVITPQGVTYKFGNGGGTLYVQSNLTGVGRGVSMNNGSVVPLTLYLQGNNSYTGTTVVTNGFVIFDFDAALPAGTTLTASTAGGSYIGYTDAASLSFAAFSSQINTGAYNGIIGFDTHAGNSTAVISDNINLSSFNTGVYLGTTTSAQLTGILSYASDHVLRLTAAQGGTLTVGDGTNPITDGLSPLSLSLGTTSPNDIYSSGTVSLPYANTYSGGTTINSTAGGLTLSVGDNGSLGSGALNLPQGVTAGLQASNYGVALPNPIVFAVGATPAQLFITDYHGIELDGDISGPGSISVMDPGSTSLALGGNNTFTGDINLYNATLYLNNDNAAGLGTIRFLNDSTLNFNTLNPVIHGIQGADGTINMNDGLALTIDMSISTNDHEFGGFMGNESPPNASVTVTSTTGGDALYLYGNSNYSGGTFIGTGNTDHAALALGADSDQVLGSGPVVLNTGMGGALALNVGVTFNSDLNYKNGVLQGFGNFQPASLTEGGMPVSVFTFDAGKGVVPGIYGLGNKSVTGKLTITSGVDFASGGAMLWSIQDGARTDGFSTLIVDGSTGGSFNVSANPGGQFNLFLASLDSTGAPGAASNLTFGSNNSFLLVHGINGATITWDSVQSDFNIDTSLFATPVSSVFLSQVGDDLFINFTAVPEPSTYALMGLGLGAVLFPALRRRKRA